MALARLETYENARKVGDSGVQLGTASEVCHECFEVLAIECLPGKRSARVLPVHSVRAAVQLANRALPPPTPALPTRC